jgi:hypothetical protein
MNSKYHIANDEYQFGDIAREIEISQGKDAWDYYWRDSRMDSDWVNGSSDRVFFSSKEAAKRAISRLVQKWPEMWEETEFLVVKVSDR